MPPACPQNPPQSHVRVPAFPDQEPRAPWSEDCLVVNVWAPSNRSRDPTSRFVWEVPSSSIARWGARGYSFIMHIKA
jgi:hypothetical protein